ncbi:acyl-CoA dehydrogenase family protein [Smaragdicoccus niigatensis]|uniref:acyl-CoA dehydrogenase family protein n=1 Tax=Smaragdicoccus niigatensis TaxID=359359 RepID=UPI000380807B|nr:acyl-CoA dehydrogenase family protein [Smaragdicoccus niigatensis]
MTTVPYATHRVYNQVNDLVDIDAFDGDRVASFALNHYGAGWAADRARALATTVWSADTQQAARLSHRYPPELRTVDRTGHRLDIVDFHPAYHQLMRTAYRAGVHALPWATTHSGGHTARAVLSYLWNQVDGGTACPTGMTYAAVPILQSQPGLEVWAEKTAALDYDPTFAPVQLKTSAHIGFAMTEKQGGSDLRANQTTAVPATGSRGPGEAYLLTGHKWFFSVPMSDAFFTLAHTEAGPSCFFVPRFTPDGHPNTFQLQRLKDKLGNRNNASSEIEYRDTWGILVGEEGRGISTILESADLTRLDFAVGSAGLIRAALSQALNHATVRCAFGSPLVELPVMADVLADLALEWAGAAHLGFRLAATADSDTEDDRLLSRLLTPVAKFWNCKRAPVVVAEALECLGGNGYIEEHHMPRYYREAPLNAIWEGTSNMMVTDVQRVLVKEPKALEPYLDEVRLAVGNDPRLDATLTDLELAATTPDRLTGRRLVATMALALQGSLLIRHAPGAVADAFCASRLGGDWAPTFGTLPRGVDAAGVLDYARLG